MAQLILHNAASGLMARLPRQILLNGQLIGIMRVPEVRIELPEGRYDLSVRFGGPVPLFRSSKTLDLSVSGSQEVFASEEKPAVVSFFDRERIWNILFDIDLLLWIAEFFITLPYPYDLIYKVLSNAFFVVWMLRIVLIRKRYYKFHIS